MASSPAPNHAASDIDPSGMLLAPPQVKGSHDLVVEVGELPAKRTVVAPDYQAMAVGDIATLTALLLLDGEDYGLNIVSRIEITEAHLGLPLQWTVCKNELHATFEAHMSYVITHVGGGRPTESAVQVFTLGQSAAPQLLPPPSIKDFSEGDLDPDAHPNGITLVIPAYLDIQPGDDMLVYISDAAAIQPMVKNLRADRSTVNTGLMQVRIEHAWLQANNGNEVSFEYQYARAGKAGSGQALTVQIARAANRPWPIVAGAELGIIPGTASICAGSLLQGATVRLPPDAELGNGTVSMYWSADFQVQASADGSFHIPPAQIPAHIDQHLDVYYTVTPQGGGAAKPSAYLDLEVLKPAGEWPPLEYEGSYPISRTAPARFRLGEWKFFAAGQRIRVRFKALRAGQETTHETRTGASERVTDAEFTAKEVWASVPVSFLRELDASSPVTVEVHASFDGGQHYIALPFVSNRMDG